MNRVMVLSIPVETTIRGRRRKWAPIDRVPILAPTPVMNGIILRIKGVHITQTRTDVVGQHTLTHSDISGERCLVPGGSCESKCFNNYRLDLILIQNINFYSES
jgi:hypothetical protein